MSERYVCNECYAHVESGQELTAPNPFRPGDLLYGCPECREINALRLCCDEPGCWSMASCGAQPDRQLHHLFSESLHRQKTLATDIAKRQAEGTAQ
jgi:hypothetical protein